MFYTTYMTFWNWTGLLQICKTSFVSAVMALLHSVLTKHFFLRHFVHLQDYLLHLQSFIRLLWDSSLGLHQDATQASSQRVSHLLSVVFKT